MNRGHTKDNNTKTRKGILRKCLHKRSLGRSANRGLKNTSHRDFSSINSGT